MRPSPTGQSPKRHPSLSTNCKAVKPRGRFGAVLRQFIAPRSAGKAVLNVSPRTVEEMPSALTTRLHFQVGFGEHLPLLVAETPPADDRPGLLYGRAHAEGVQHAHPVGLHADACPDGDGVPGRAPLDELPLEAPPMQGAGHGEAADSSADDQDSFNVGHLHPSPTTGCTA